MVHKKLQDNFKDYDKVTIDATIIEGKTLREKLIEDTQAHLESPRDHPMGANYYKKLKELYKPSASPAFMLKVQDQRLAVNDQLMKAMVAAKAAIPNRGPLVEYLATGPPPNQTELVGISKYAIALKPTITTTQLPVALDICKWMSKHGLLQKYPAEMELMLPWIDAVLVQAYIQVKKSALRLQTFIELHRSTLTLILDMALVDKLVAAKGSWLDVSEALNKVVASSKLGHKMFSFACEHVLAAEVKAIIDLQIAALQEKGPTKLHMDPNTLVINSLWICFVKSSWVSC
jgi:menaquinone-dependent protoporphyrinogen IX oxidase